MLSQLLEYLVNGGGKKKINILFSLKIVSLEFSSLAVFWEGLKFLAPTDPSAVC